MTYACVSIYIFGGSLSASIPSKHNSSKQPFSSVCVWFGPWTHTHAGIDAVSFGCKYNEVYSLFPCCYLLCCKNVIRKGFVKSTAPWTSSLQYLQERLSKDHQTFLIGLCLRSDEVMSFLKVWHVVMTAQPGPDATCRLHASTEGIAFTQLRLTARIMTHSHI